ncbi:hypothetical protein KGY73_05610 [bacterium]|nr:hypothetical protein [bacterium]
MKRYVWIIPFILILFTFAASLYSSPQQRTGIEKLKDEAPRVFIDCDRCPIDYIRQEITFVNYVWDRKEAEVHVLITTQRTGAGGREYTLTFIGQKDFEDLESTLTYYTSQTDTEEEVRRGLVRVLKLGLAPYVARTPMSQAVSMKTRERVRPTAVEDKWNFWVFNVGLRTRLNGESTRSSVSLDSNFSANRVTLDSKLKLGVDLDYDHDRYEVDGEIITSDQKRGDFDGLYVWSLSDHWSVGGYLSLSSSTYNNIHFSVVPQPAVEYNFFPYSISTRRQLRVLYKVGYNYFNYIEETIYNKMEQGLMNEEISVILQFKEPWGSAGVVLSGSHYFHDFSKNRWSLGGDISVRLIKGLRLSVRGNYSSTHDQLSLPKGEASLEEILLRRREIATEFRYFVSVGLDYSFGSIFSNVVNPRFGERRRFGRHW